MAKETKAIYKQIATNRKQSDEVRHSLDAWLRFMEQFWMGKGLPGTGRAAT